MALNYAGPGGVLAVVGLVAPGHTSVAGVESVVGRGTLLHAHLGAVLGVVVGRRRLAVARKHAHVGNAVAVVPARTVQCTRVALVGNGVAVKTRTAVGHADPNAV